ncbi:DNA-binding MurR/RpiR family transcriptional regulator [Microbacterium halimionae]|uniref:DNA-binding MurR/RpiR family transcriptional regulator n=1 Tax=Microbacterium halimionae TaxID=1526413 RepID=A0A7W3PN48_9MICO|nr:MurR/RpiR family transcriptional regulator [Microbacterium halimionae]MBA8817589.1 DNA-binding MurR/RpiR family transcriptional regulator [Microbacterium halimionae]NII94299.1 DNA-binding MurR/RpiR family transcriptional regulator [Microbacterium halimionae]
MAWHGAADAPPTARIVALAPSLQPTEQRIAEAIAADIGGTIERTAQELAEAVGVGRASVIRAAQSLGYDGYPQLRVALAQELAREAPIRDTISADGTMVGALRAEIDRFGSRLGHTVSALTEEAVAAFVNALDEAARVLVVANGLSAPLGLDMVLRLSAAGRPAEQLADAVAQQIAARQLGRDSICLVLSGSGANRATLAAASAARQSGARVVVITSFAKSAITDLADVTLVIPPVNDTFRDELVHTSRAALMLLTEGLVDLLVVQRGDRGREARRLSLSVLGGTIQE